MLVEVKEVLQMLSLLYEWLGQPAGVQFQLLSSVGIVVVLLVAGWCMGCFKKRN